MVYSLHCLCVKQLIDAGVTTYKFTELSAGREYVIELEIVCEVNEARWKTSVIQRTSKSLL